MTQVVTLVLWVPFPAGERHERLEMEYVAPGIMKLKDQCVCHLGTAESVEMLVIFVSDRAELLIDMVSAHGW